MFLLDFFFLDGIDLTDVDETHWKDPLTDKCLYFKPEDSSNNGFYTDDCSGTYAFVTVKEKANGSKAIPLSFFCNRFTKWL